MKIHSTSRIAHPRAAVFAAYRDKMPEIAKYIPDIRQIIVHSREEQGAVVTLRNEWVSDRDIPALFSRIIRPEQLRWDDFASWDSATYACDWRLQTRVFTDAFRCSGQTRLSEDGSGTQVELIGELRLDLKGRIPGMPGIVADKLAPQLEKFIVGLISPNLELTNVAIGKYLDHLG